MAIPLSWNDPMFSSVTDSTYGGWPSGTGWTVSNVSFTDSSGQSPGDPAVGAMGSFTLDTVRIDAREGVRIGGSGDINISNSYIETTGLDGDHADGIQAYDPGGVGNVTITNTAIVSHEQNANAGFWSADGYSGTFTFNNVMFEGGNVGLRIAADTGDDYIALHDVYFVGPFEGAPFLFQEAGGNIHITQWDNVRSATIVNGQLVPGDLIPPPQPVEGGAPTTPTTPTAPGAPTIASFSTDSGVAGDKITNDNTLELKGTAAAGSTVKIYDGTTQIGSTIATSTGSWDYITQVLTDAKHALTATATNSSGQTSAASAALAVTVDTKAPAAPTVASDTVNSANQVVVSGTAEANSAIRVFDGTTQIGTATTNSSGAWSVTTSALASGSHVLTANATDVAGNVSAASTAVDPVIGTGTSGTSGTGTTAPAAPKIASFSTDSGVAGDQITSDNTLTLAGSAAANSTVKVFDGTTQLGIVTADANGAWHYTTATLADGKHGFTATDTVSGVLSAKSAALDVTVDSTAPNAPVLLTDSTSHHRATVTGTAEAGSAIKLYEGTDLLGTTTTGTDGHFSVTTTGLKNGSHTFTATATDASGNTSALSLPIDPPIGSHGPKDASTVEVTNVRQHWDHTATIRGTADPGSQIKLSDGTTSASSVTAGADGKWSFHTSDLSGKTHAFTAEQVDTTGHVVGPSSGEALIGTGRSNTLTGTTGNDIMVGKGGADTFVFASNFGRDVIKDFATSGPAHDTVQFSKGVFDSFASVLSHAGQSGHDVVVTAGSDTLTLKNTQLDKLNSHDFHFA